jgi:ribosome assembly protein YihI (activator of Der GTPase)
MKNWQVKLEALLEFCELHDEDDSLFEDLLSLIEEGEVLSVKQKIMIDHAIDKYGIEI